LGRCAGHQYLAASFSRHDADQQARQVGLVYCARPIAPVLHQPRHRVGREHRFVQAITLESQANHLGGIPREVDDVLIVDFRKSSDVLLSLDPACMQQIEELRELVGGLQPQDAENLFIFSCAFVADAIEELLLRPPQAFQEDKIRLDLRIFSKALATFHVDISMTGIGCRWPANELEAGNSVATLQARGAFCGPAADTDRYVASMTGSMVERRK
jgi:hypothetical protein